MAAFAALGWLCANGLPARAEPSESGEAAAQALIREGIRHLEAGNADRAIRQFERAVQLAPADPFTYLHLARGHSAARRFPEAHKVLAKAVIHAHGEKKILYDVELTRGDLFRAEGKIELARSAYEKAAGLRYFSREARERLKGLEAPPGAAAEE